MDTLQLLIVADDPLAGAGLSMLLGEMPGCHIIGQVSSGTLASELHSWSDLDPDAILWDLGWELPDPLPEWIDTPVPTVALMGDDLYVTELWAAGIRGLLHRDSAGETWLEAIQAVCHGLIVIDPAWAPALIAPNVFTESSPAEALTPRETEVLQLLAEGLTNKALGQRLSISEHTVKFHVNAIMSKLSAQSRTEAVVQATRAGLISL